MQRKKLYVNRTIIGGYGFSNSNSIVIILIVLIQIVQVSAGVSEFRVYDEDRILSRLKSAPLITFQSQSPVSYSTFVQRFGDYNPSPHQIQPQQQQQQEQQHQHQPQQQQQFNVQDQRQSQQEQYQLIQQDQHESEVQQSQHIPTSTTTVKPRRRRLKKVTVRPIYNDPPQVSPSSIPPETTPYQKRRRIRQDIGPGQKRRIRKVIRKNKVHEALAPGAHSILDTYNAKDVEIYSRGQPIYDQSGGYALPNPTAWSSTDLQLEESIHPGIFNASSIPISNDFYDPSTSVHGEPGLEGGSKYKLEYLHPLLTNSDSQVTRTEPHFPENKTVSITHSLSEEVAGEIPVTSDFKFRNKLRKNKHPLLHNQDSSLAGEFHVISKNIDAPIIETTTVRQYRKKMSSKIPQKLGTSTVSHTGVVPTTSIPTIVTSSISISSSSSVNKPRPTIRLTRRTTTTVEPPTVFTTLPSSSTTPKRTTTTIGTTTLPSSTTPKRTTTTTGTTTTTRKNPPKEVIYSESVANQDTAFSGPQVVELPPKSHNKITNRPALTAEEAILSSILGGTSGIQNSQNGQDYLNIFNLFTTPTPPPPPKLTTRRTTTTTTTPKPRPKTTTTPKATTPSQAEIDNLLQIALLEGLLGGNNNGLGSTTTNSLRSASSAPAQQTNNQLQQNQNQQTPDLFGLNALLGNLGGGNAFANQNQQQFITTPRPFSLFGGLAGLGQQTTARPFSLLGGLFGGGLQPTQRPFSLFGNLLGGGLQTTARPFSLFGGGGQQQPFSLFGGLGNQNQQQSLFGGLGNLNQQQSLFGSGSNSLLSLLNPSTTQRPIPTKPPPRKPEISASDAEILQGLQDLGLAAGPETKRTKAKSSAPTSNPNPNTFDINAILSGTNSNNNNNWLGSNNGLSNPVTAKPDTSPSETSQLLNILFNRPTGLNRPSGPYWWLDMNSFMGGNRNSNNPTEGLRTKSGTREHFIKV